jgi:hypothetical protein
MGREVVRPLAPVADPCQAAGWGSGIGGHRAPRVSRRETVAGPGRGASEAGESGGATWRLAKWMTVGLSGAALASRLRCGGWIRALRLGHGAGVDPGQPGTDRPLWTKGSMPGRLPTGA